MLRSFIVFACLLSVDGCTTVLVTKGAATKEIDSCFVSHSNDGEGDTDGRLIKVPPRVNKLPVKRPIFASHLNFPRYVGTARGVNNYPPIPGYQENFSKPIGFIDEVAETFGVFEAVYGIENDQGVVMAESTCEGIFGARPRPHGKALFSIEELSKIALERSKTALEAVKLMGYLAEREGFYGAGFEGPAESLLVADRDHGWIFHVLADDSGSSAVWAAQKVKDGSVAVVTNAFVIREMNFSDTDNFLASRNIQAIALKLGLWKQGTPFDFSRIYGKGEYNAKYYSGRRQWRAFHMLAPFAAKKAMLEPLYGSLRYDSPYPAFLLLDGENDKKISVQDLFKLMRDSYEGTRFSLTQGLAAGPFGTPDRYNKGHGESLVPGAWERPISIFRSTYSFIALARQSILFWGPHAAKTTCYVPLSVHMPDVPAMYKSVWQGRFSRNDAYWAFRYVATIAQVKFSYMIKEISELQGAMEHKALFNVFRRNVSDEESSFAVYKTHAQVVLESWWALADQLVFRYADGFINEVSSEYSPAFKNGKKLTFTAKPTGYPEEWLRKVGYSEGPPPLDKASWDINSCPYEQTKEIISEKAISQDQPSLAQ